MDRPFAELDALYREVVLDHYRSPRGRDPLPAPDVENRGFNPVCGDEVLVALRIDGEIVREVQVKGRGCAISVASGSMLAEMLPGRTLAEAARIVDALRLMLRGEEPPRDLDLGDLDSLRGVAKFPVRIKCAMLPWMTFNEAVRAYDLGGKTPETAATTEESGG